MLFVHKSIKHLISNINSHAVATGICDRVGNKGGIGISITVGTSTFCFLTAHLAAHQSEMDRRTEEFSRISEEMAETLGAKPTSGGGKSSQHSTEEYASSHSSAGVWNSCYDDNNPEIVKALESQTYCRCFLHSSSICFCRGCGQQSTKSASPNPLSEIFDFVFWGWRL